jgi:diguanylate cyclase (GGDEF)-like protein
MIVDFLKPRPSRAFERFIDALLDWTPIQRALLLSFLIFIETFQYVVWGGAVMLMSDLEAVALSVDQQVVIHFMPFSCISLLISSSVLGICWYFRHSTSPRLSVWIPVLMAHSYGLNMVYFGYLVGSMSMVTGVVLMGAPVFGLMLVERKTVYSALVVGFLGLSILSLLSLQGVIDYAPMLIDADKNGIAGSDFWFWSMLFFMVPHLVVSVLMCDLLMTSLRRRELEVRYLSERDSLTGLYNRRSINTYLQEMIQRARSQRYSVAVLLLDLDHFKSINDTYGHLSGDDVLVEASRVLQACVREQDIVGRFGGEEFVVILEDIDEATTYRIAERIRAQLEALQVLDEQGQSMPVRGSIGMTFDQVDSTTAYNTLIHKADQALYRAKLAGRNQVMRFKDIDPLMADARANKR